MGFIDTIAISSAIPTGAVPLALSWPLWIPLLAGGLTAGVFGLWAAASRQHRPVRRFSVIRTATAS